MVEVVETSEKRTVIEFNFTLSDLISEGEKQDEDSQDSGVTGRAYADYVRLIRGRQQDRVGTAGQVLFRKGREDADTPGSKRYVPPISAEYNKRT